eukprot:COSAG02_NODE_228_length_28131_cov_25.387093_7_plen_64_part_00
MERSTEGACGIENLKSGGEPQRGRSLAQSRVSESSASLTVESTGSVTPRRNGRTSSEALCDPA